MRRATAELIVKDPNKFAHHDRVFLNNPVVMQGMGLAPLVVQDIFSIIREINKQGVTVLLVEQNARAALKLASRGYVLEVGNVAMEDTAANLLADASVREAYLGG